ncbi:hypothetical protein HDU76_003018, partial [Blyttiomyces sp. JEL0837]
MSTPSILILTMQILTSSMDWKLLTCHRQLQFDAAPKSLAPTVQDDIICLILEARISHDEIFHGAVQIATVSRQRGILNDMSAGIVAAACIATAAAACLDFNDGFSGTVPALVKNLGELI